MSRMVDLTGTKSGKLTVLAPHGKDKYGRFTWFCACECGSGVVVRSNNLRTGNSKSCGCEKNKIGSQIKDLTGRTFGELTVIKRDMSRADNGKVYWLCRCSCGEVVSVWMAHLLRKHNVRCSIKGKHVESDSGRRSLWSEKVKELYRSTCQKCGSQDEIHAHHILSFTAYPDLRFDVDNGACLCSSCHKEFHRIYGIMRHTKENFESWISN